MTWAVFGLELDVLSPLSRRRRFANGTFCVLDRFILIEADDTFIVLTDGSSLTDVSISIGTTLPVPTGAFGAPKTH